MSAKGTVIAAVAALFLRRGAVAVDRYFDTRRARRSSHPEDVADGVHRLASRLPADFAYELVRAIAENDLVVLHGVYSGLGPTGLVAFDVFRVDGDRVVEHWDSLAPIVVGSASGRSQTDGPTEPTDFDRTAQNKAVVREFVERVLIGGDYGRLTEYIESGSYAEHNPEVADGLQGFGAAVAAWAEDGKPLAYNTVHQIVAEGDFVFTCADGDFGVPVVYADLWRLKDRRIVEHWDVISPLPSELHAIDVF